MSPGSAAPPRGPLGGSQLSASPRPAALSAAPGAGTGGLRPGRGRKGLGPPLTLPVSAPSLTPSPPQTPAATSGWGAGGSEDSFLPPGGSLRRKSASPGRSSLSRAGRGGAGRRRAECRGRAARREQTAAAAGARLRGLEAAPGSPRRSRKPSTSWSSGLPCAQPWMLRFTRTPAGAGSRSDSPTHHRPKAALRPPRPKRTWLASGA